MSKRTILKKLHQLPPQTEFTYKGRRYRTITHPGRTIVLANHMATVLVLPGCKSARIGYHELVKVQG
jgi:hypothetical protein